MKAQKIKIRPNQHDKDTIGKLITKKSNSDMTSVYVSLKIKKSDTNKTDILGITFS